MSTATVHTTPDLQSLSEETLTQWVAACVDGRKNGATPGDMASLCRVLKRLAPTLAAALATPAQTPDFEQTLEALARG